MVMLPRERRRKDSEAANPDRQPALRRLEVLPSPGPLASALNRHAYQTLVAGRGGAGPELAGCVAVADVNRLKEINDRDGHVWGHLPSLGAPPPTPPSPPPTTLPFAGAAAGSFASFRASAHQP